MFEKSYSRDDFKDIPRHASRFLVSLENHRGPRSWPRDYKLLAEKLDDENPVTVILFCELLARQHWKYKRYVDMRRVELMSEIDEAVFRHFSTEINQRMADYLEKHSDPDDLHLGTLTREYYPEAKKILRKEYKCRYPRSWKNKWHEKRYLKPRKRLEKKRRYDMPVPLGLGETCSPQQFYFMRKSGAYVRGGHTGSSLRENHSYYGLAFLALSRERQIPSYILVYDRDNVLRFVDRLRTFVLLPDSMGSNCHEDRRTIHRMMKNRPVARAVHSQDCVEVEKIHVHPFTSSSSRS
ncbi:hypothetical protein ACFLU6_10425 [Acidobacteriota bacterium]